MNQLNHDTKHDGEHKRFLMIIYVGEDEVGIRAHSLIYVLGLNTVSVDELNVQPLIQYIQKNVKKWNKEEIIITKRTLHRFTPLIKFYHITSENIS
ncbi:unnamed protein product [Rhizophagus irregularis]|nr:unnamed protein product [Rhizophagus irregularis]